MDATEFDAGYWEDVWDGVPLPVAVEPSREREFDAVLRRHLPAGDRTLVEVGCAPGGWLAYFHRRFGYRVSGLDYAERAVGTTRRNLEMLDVPARIEHADFFAWEGGPFDVVFSSGFVEHFADPDETYARLVRLARPGGGLVVTVVPALRGLNWWISRRFRPAVAQGHFPVDRDGLVAWHERHGLRTVHATYVGGGIVVPPVEKNDFARRHPAAAAVANLPFRVWNKAVRTVTGGLGRYPELAAVNNGAVYVGRRP